ncbi:MAG TPA: hypothetical protein VGP18_13250 [Solirubrobacteraceae bacterium]|jgi:hypothetical protein|nr:hypothetical protein [Solirubrobacteraceae bacterium]
MSECDEQLRHVCRWNYRLARENSRLRLELQNKEHEIRALEKANADCLLERDAINTALGAAIDEALKARQR